jgi:hypothetical protein
LARAGFCRVDVVVVVVVAAAVVMFLVGVVALRNDASESRNAGREQTVGSRLSL